MNKSRLLVNILNQYAMENNIELLQFADNWIFRLASAGKSHIVFGYDLGLNSSTTASICNDKAATYDLLNAQDIAAVEHCVFLHPRFFHHMSTQDNWVRIRNIFEKFNGDVVLKPNEGTGGNDVYHVKSLADLEFHTHQILNQERSIAISPYFLIEEEIRIYVLDHQAVQVISKTPPFVIGDGHTDVLSLAINQLGVKEVESAIKNSDALIFENLALKPDAGAQVTLTWKNNLGQGAIPSLDKISNQKRAADLAINAAQAIDLKFGSVDVIISNNAAYILEINNGVMLENFAKQIVGGEEIARRIYKKALDSIFMP